MRCFFLNYVILPATLVPEFTQPQTEMSNRHRKIKLLESRARPVCRADSLTPSVSRLSIQCGILDISQPCKPPRLVVRIALLLTFLIMQSVFSYETLVPMCHITRCSNSQDERQKAWNPMKQGHTLSSHHPLYLHYVAAGICSFWSGAEWNI
jgi:hypothetical protein